MKFKDGLAIFILGMTVAFFLYSLILGNTMFTRAIYACETQSGTYIGFISYEMNPPEWCDQFAEVER